MRRRPGRIKKMNAITAPAPSEPLHRSSTAALVLGAIGVVFGDIGTSPLYALKEAFSSEHGIPRGGAFVGRATVIWFLATGAAGVAQLAKNPAVVHALKPAYAVDFMFGYPMAGFLVLGAVFLALTGGEALYADMGHFGRRPIPIASISLLFPALLLTYFGQAAFVLANPAGIKSPFFLMLPEG